MNASNLIRAIAKKFGKPGNFEPSARPPQFAPGDYRDANAKLLEQTEGLRIMAELWEMEAKETENSELKFACLELMKTYAHAYELQKHFYSRWEIPEE